MRALFIVNPQATATTRRTRDVIARAFASDLRLEVAHTEYRDHARALAARATEEGYDLVLTLGGDGTVNEVVNGILSVPDDRAHPVVAALPGGNANVFVRALGLPTDPVEATGALLDGLRSDARRHINLGRVDDGYDVRYFTFCAGFGWDASAVREVERERGSGARVTPGRYIAAAARVFAADRTLRSPSLSLHLPDARPVSRLYVTLVTNTTPWTYAGRLPVQPTPRSRFDLGLDVFAMDRLDTVTTLATLGRMLSRRGAPPRGRGFRQWHDYTEFTVRAGEPRAFQVDGEYLGNRTRVDFCSVPKALQVIA